MKIKRWTYLLIGLLVLAFIGFKVAKKFNFNSDFSIGQRIDSLNGVFVYYNGGVDHVSERNTTTDSYNIGLKYQCVEFVKRYYYEHLNHKMPDTYGHAKDFFNKNLSDSSYNAQRDLMQYSNPAKTQPQVGDLLIFKAIEKHVYGHVAIISRVEEKEVEIIQQNPLWTEGSRAIFPLVYENEHWKIKHELILGWLRKETM